MATERATLVIEPHTPLDEPWNSQLRAITEMEMPIYEQLLPTKAELEAEKARFFAARGAYNPDLGPRHLDDKHIDEQSLQSFKNALLADETLSPDIRQAYRWRVNEFIAERRMLCAASQGDKRRFEAYNHFIYGRPNGEIFAATTDWFRQQADEALSSEDDALREAAQQVLDVVPNMGGSRFLLVPDDETYRLVRERHYRPGGHFALLFAGVTLPERGPVTPEVGEPILEGVRSNLHAEEYEIADAAGKTWSVSHGPKQLLRPANYSMPLNRFVGLGPGHEWAHVLERINGDRQPLRLSGLGLDRYENGNEGRAVMREQVPYESFEAFSKQLRWQDILRRHFAVSLAEGLAGEKLDFSHVYEVVNAVDRLWERQKNPTDIAAADKKAEDRTWSLLATRVLRGTDGKGGAYLKDKVYLEGNVACWAAARNHPELIEQGDLGKFDIANPRHIALLQAVGVLPRMETDL